MGQRLEDKSLEFAEGLVAGCCDRSLYEHSSSTKHNTDHCTFQTDQCSVCSRTESCETKGSSHVVGFRTDPRADNNVALNHGKHCFVGQYIPDCEYDMAM